MLLSDQVAMGLNYRMKLQVQMVRGQLSCFFACAKFLHGITAMFFVLIVSAFVFSVLSCM